MAVSLHRIRLLLVGGALALGFLLATPAARADVVPSDDPPAATVQLFGNDPSAASAQLFGDDPAPLGGFTSPNGYGKG